MESIACPACYIIRWCFFYASLSDFTYLLHVLSIVAIAREWRRGRGNCETGEIIYWMTVNHPD